MALRGAAEAARRAVERIAWAVEGSSRRFFVVLAAAVGVGVAVASVLASQVVEWNSDDVAIAQSRGFVVASEVTQFRHHLGVADELLAATLVRGDEPPPLARARADDDLRAASLSLTEAGVGASGDNAVRVTDLGADLVRYLALVETARVYPVGSRFHDDARRQARCLPAAEDEDDCPTTREAGGPPVALVVSADTARRAAEADLTAAVDRVTGGWRLLWVVLLGLAGLLLLAANGLVAGRTRIWFHPGLLVATVAFGWLTYVVVDGVKAEREAMRDVADEQAPALAAANSDLFGVLTLRSDELDAVASPSQRTAFYGRFDATAEELAASLDRQHGDDDTAPVENLRRRLATYEEQVAQVRSDVAAGAAPTEAVDQTLDGTVAGAYRSALGVAASSVERANADMAAQLAEAEAAGAGWSSVALDAVGVGAGLVAAAAVLHRGRHYLVRAGGTR